MGLPLARRLNESARGDVKNRGRSACWFVAIPIARCDSRGWPTGSPFLVDRSVDVGVYSYAPGSLAWFDKGVVMHFARLGGCHHLSAFCEPKPTVRSLGDSRLVAVFVCPLFLRGKSTNQTEHPLQKPGGGRRSDLKTSRRVFWAVLRASSPLFRASARCVIFDVTAAPSPRWSPRWRGQSSIPAHRLWSKWKTLSITRSRTGESALMCSCVGFQELSHRIGAVESPRPSVRHGTRNSFERSEERRVGKECRSRWSPYH